MTDPKERSKSLNEKLPGGLSGVKDPRRQIDGWVGLGIGLAVVVLLLVYSQS